MQTFPSPGLPALRTENLTHTETFFPNCQSRLARLSKSTEKSIFPAARCCIRKLSRDQVTTKTARRRRPEFRRVAPAVDIALKFRYSYCGSATQSYSSWKSVSQKSVSSSSSLDSKGGNFGWEPSVPEVCGTKTWWHHAFLERKKKTPPPSSSVWRWCCPWWLLRLLLSWVFVSYFLPVE